MTEKKGFWTSQNDKKWEMISEKTNDNIGTVILI
jgi:hypothetical protein